MCNMRDRLSPDSGVCLFVLEFLLQNILASLYVFVSWTATLLFWFSLTTLTLFLAVTGSFFQQKSHNKAIVCHLRDKVSK